MEQVLCPSCAFDGGYGTAVRGAAYECPRCWVVWHVVDDDREPVRGLLAWWQRVKVWLTSNS